MILDTSAIVAIIFEETDRDVMLTTIAAHTVRSLSAVSLFESAIVIDGLGDAVLSLALDALIDDLQVNIVDVTARQVRIARRAYATFGKGSGHRARLNFGDCFSYALAIERDEPLLFKGDDFNHTDVKIAIPQDR